MHRGGWFRSGLAVAAVVSLANCGEELVVRESTRVYRDGSVFRMFQIAGREGDGKLPEEPRWLEDNAKLVLASPGSWESIEERPGYLAAEQTFDGVEEVPPLLAHAEEREEGGRRQVLDRSRLELTRDDLVLLRRWVFRETRGDPYGIEELEEALEQMIDLAVRFFREEARREFGPEIDVGRAEAFLRGEVRDLLADVLRILRRTTEIGRDEEAIRPIAELLTRRGVVRPGEIPLDEIEGDWILEVAGPHVADWMLAGLARGLSSPERPIDAADLDFWPSLDDAAILGEETDQPLDARTEEFVEIGGALLRALSGYYGDGSSPRFRFESRLEMPGRLLRTNGTPDGRGVVWLYRNVDLTLGDIVLEAESIELDDEALRTLGARRDLDTARVLQLTDLLSRDATGELARLLSEAVDRGSLSVLLDEELVSEDALMPARELYELLDPTQVAWPR